MAQLESLLKGFDPYNRPRSNQEKPSFVTMKSEELELHLSPKRRSKSYKIERLLNKRESRDKTRYLVKWKDYELAHNV